MKTGKIAFLLILLAFLSIGNASAQNTNNTQTQSQSPPVVTIVSPKNGVTGEKILSINGIVSDPTINFATIVHNGENYRMRVEYGRFSRNLVAYPGDNWIEVTAENGYGSGKATAFIKAVVEPMDMKVILTWDKDKTDIDLWVTDPEGEKCYYANRNTGIGGLLDLDNTSGFGPETFTLPKAISGNYLISAHYYGNRSRIVVPVNVKLEVVLYPGTPKEVRKVYSTFIKKTNDAADVANILIQ
jgi:uncharacterized protein YfaP (DUF2135 family)